MICVSHIKQWLDSFSWKYSVFLPQVEDPDDFALNEYDVSFHFPSQSISMNQTFSSAVH